MMGISESADQMPSANIDRFKPLPFFQRYGRQIGLPVIVVTLIVLFTANSEVFFSVANFRNIGVSAAALAAVSFGQTFAILTAGLDLSVGSIVALVSIVGGNEEAARLSGIRIGAIKTAAYVSSGICAAVGSIILTARVASGQPSLGTTLPLESVAAVVLGGISLFGGRGSVVGVAFGVLFVSILSNRLNLLNVPSYTQMMVIGGALILAVALDQAFIESRIGKKA